MTQLKYRWVLPRRVWSMWEGTPTHEDPNPYYMTYVGHSKDYGYEGVCSCKGWTFGKTKFCKHCRESLRKMTYEERREFMTEEIKGYVESSIPKINSMQKGYPIGTLQAFVGRSRSGKTLLTLQEAMFINRKNGKNIVLVMTEARDGFFQIKPWVKRLNERFKTNFEALEWRFDEPKYLSSCYQYTPKTGKLKMKDGKPVMKFHYNLPWIKEEPKTDNPKVIALQMPSLFSLFLLLGFPAEVRNTDGGKQEVLPRPEWEMLIFFNTPLGMILLENNVGFLALDSISAPLKNIFVAGERSYSGRANVIALILSRFDYFAKNLLIPCFIINHLSENESRSGSVKAFGGSMIRYTHKFELEMMGKADKYIRNVRIPDVEPYKYEIKYKIGDKGIYGL